MHGTINSYFSGTNQGITLKSHQIGLLVSYLFSVCSQATNVYKNVIHNNKERQTRAFFQHLATEVASNVKISKLPDTRFVDPVSGDVRKRKDDVCRILNCQQYLFIRCIVHM